jgi:asparagine synthetase B (glutamine-hydrolysing)
MCIEVVSENIPKFKKFSHPLGELFYLGSSNLSWSQLVEKILKGQGFNEIRGNFAFVWVGERDWVAAVDHLSSIPLFFSDNCISNLFCDLMAKLENPQKNRSIEFQMGFLGGQSFYSDETTVQGIRRILPGHYVKNGKATPYIDYLSYLGDEPPNPLLFRNLTESIFSDLVATENTLLLSGGTDSTALAAISKKLRVDKSFHYLNIFSSLQLSEEKETVEQVAKDMELEVRFQEILLSGDIDPEISHRQFCFWIENPFPGKRKAIELNGRSQTRIFTGEIGDQLFGGPKNPALLNYAFQTKNISPEAVAKIWVNLSDTYGRESGFATNNRIEAVIESDSVAREAYTQLVGNIADVFEKMKSKDYLHRIMLLNYLVKGPYRMWAYSQDSLDWAHPFADWQLFDYCFRRPSNEKVSSGGISKSILLEHWRSYLSELPWQKGKSGFGIPAKNKFRAPIDQNYPAS